MKISLESHPDINEIVSYDDDRIVIRTASSSEPSSFTDNLIISPETLTTNKSINFANQDDVDYLLTLNAQVLICVQNPLQTIPPRVIAQFSRSGVGIELMLLGPACRTYNLLAAEGRQVLLLINFEKNQQGN